MTYRRGFKTEAEVTAQEVRRELDLGGMDPLDPRVLAEHLAIPVLSLSDLELASEGSAGYFLDTEPKTFSAVTVFRGLHRTIVHNDAHAPVRQHSNLAHELAHGLLGHAPTPALDDRGCRLWNQNVEDEAAFLGGALLLPRDACIATALRGDGVSDIARHFEISEEMVRYRLGVSGARTIATRSRLRRRK